MEKIFVFHVSAHGAGGTLPNELPVRPPTADRFVFRTKANSDMLLPTQRCAGWLLHVE
jgi:hypothetical protein